jgi:hypothetical protein
LFDSLGSFFPQYFCFDVANPAIVDQDLPLDVKPLLRDPRQTSRTGGNSKRHIYAYRGVCRQARKGHDRWQSQISFAGVNHYLGTFDSEWDAAAIYAWAHLILYGEEATKLAQKEGEEAAAAYEQEQRDLAAGKIPEPPNKSETKKKAPIRKPKETRRDSGTPVSNSDEPKQRPGKRTKSQEDAQKESIIKQDAKLDGIASGDTTTKYKKTITGRRESLNTRTKNESVSSKQSISIEKEALIIFLAKSVMKSPMLGPRINYLSVDDTDLLAMVGHKLKMSRTVSYTGTHKVPGEITSADECIRPCIPCNKNSFSIHGTKNANQIDNNTHRLVGSAMLVGLSALSMGWDLQSFIEETIHKLGSDQDIMAALQLLAVEYDEDGVNEKFQSLIQGTICFIGCASTITQEMHNSLGLGSVPLGGSVGNLDCHIGGVPGSCTEFAACIRYRPNQSKTSTFQLSCLSVEDIVTLNGEIVKPEMGYIPLHHEDICSVGARVFAFNVTK